METIIPCISSGEIGNRRSTPEKRLLGAILERAFADYLGAEADKVDWEEAYRWIMSDTQRKFSFLWILDILDLDHLVNEIRAELKEMRRHNKRLPEIRTVHR